MRQDLITAFAVIGITIIEDDVETILRLGADRFLNQVRFSASEECMSTIYIIITELREGRRLFSPNVAI